MRLIGIFLIVVGSACFAFVASGLFAWTTPAPESATTRKVTFQWTDYRNAPSSLADTLAVKTLFLFMVGAVSTIGGVVALIRGIIKSRRA